MAFIFLLWDSGLVVTTDPVKISWTAPVVDADHGPVLAYEVKVVTAAKSTVRTYMYTTINSYIILNRPSVDFFEVEVRAVNPTGAGEWAKSISSSDAVFNGQPGAWRLYFMLPAPSGGGIE